MTPAQSIGRVHSWHGNALVLARALAYMEVHGGDGLRRVAERAVLNANWIRRRLSARLRRPLRSTLHARGGALGGHLAQAVRHQGARCGQAPAWSSASTRPTVYFPLIVDEALMIEPTETESLQTLEALADALETIAAEAAAGVPLSEAPRTHAGAPGGRGPGRPHARADVRCPLVGRPAGGRLPAGDRPGRPRRALRRRVRATLGGRVVLDTAPARCYVWEWPNYPQYYIPWADVRPGCWSSTSSTPRRDHRGPVRLFGLAVGDIVRAERGARLRRLGDRRAQRHGPLRMVRARQLVRGGRGDLRAPRSPYVRVDALRSTRAVRVELDGVVLADVVLAGDGVRDGSADPLLPQSDRGGLRAPGGDRDTVTSCPYKGTTSGYWSVTIGETVHRGSGVVLRLPDPSAAAHRRVGLRSTTRRSTSSSTGNFCPGPSTHFS